MRSLIFNIVFYAGTAVFAILCVLLSFLPGRRPLMAGLWLYTRTMLWAMKHIAGIKVDIRGRENVPSQGPVILAAKHQSYGDGIVLFSQFFDLSFVTGDHLEKFMTMKRILNKAGAVVINSCGGTDMRDRLQSESAIVRKQGRRILIYPEGHLSQVGTHHRYRKGIFFMYQDFDCPVVPVATNLGQRWNQQDWHKYKGDAVLEFLEPIAPGLEKDQFMRVLQERIESASLALLDYDNLGALNPADVGKEKENKIAKAKREAREQSANPEEETPEEKEIGSIEKGLKNTGLKNKGPKQHGSREQGNVQ